MRTGRPTKYTAEMPDKLTEALYEGLTVERFCRNTRIHKDTFYEWLKVHKDFSDAFRGGKSDSEAYWQEYAIKNFENKGFNSALFKLYMSNCHDWSENKSIPLSQEHEQSQDAKFDEEFKALLAKYKKEV